MKLSAIAYVYNRSICLSIVDERVDNTNADAVGIQAKWKADACDSCGAEPVLRF